MTISEKYELLRPKISSGDLILFHGTSLLSKTIQWADHAYFNHIGVVIDSYGALFILDANANGVQSDRLSYRINGYKKYSDFTIISPKENRLNIDRQMAILLKRSDDKTIKYDFDNGIKEMFNRATNTNRFKIKENDKAICSSNVYQYAINLNMVTSDFEKLRIAFPQDYIRYANHNNIKIIN